MTVRKLNMKTPQDVRRALNRVANMALNGEIDTKVANTIILACNAILGSIRTDDQQKKIDAPGKELYIRTCLYFDEFSGGFQPKIKIFVTRFPARPVALDIKNK